MWWKREKCSVNFEVWVSGIDEEVIIWFSVPWNSEDDVVLFIMILKCLERVMLRWDQKSSEDEV